MMRAAMPWMTRRSLLTRLRAGGIHLLLTAALIGSVVALGLLYWYPHGLFSAAGGLHVFLIMVAVDLTLGPTLTTIVYVPGKKGLLFDLVTIAVVQLAALGYGVHTLQLGRPVYVVFVVDRFEIVRAKDLEAGRWKNRPHLFAGVEIVGTKLPTDRDKRTELVIASMAGLDLQHFPEYYVPYPSVAPEVLKAGRPMSDLRRYNPKDAARIDRLVRSLDRPEEGLRFVAMRTGGEDAVAVVDARDATLLRFADLRPWE
jgi:hypothetical protein